MFFKKNKIKNIYKTMNILFKKLEKEGKLNKLTMEAVNKANRISSIFIQKFNEKRMYSINKKY